MARYGKMTVQILSLLSQGMLLGFTRDRKQRLEILEECDRTWNSLDRNQLFRALRILKMKKLVEIIEKGDKRKIELTHFGKLRSKNYLIYNLAVKKRKHWDGKWRIVIFDVPETRKKTRDSLRGHLKRLGFYEFQKSVFAIPYPCEDEITILTNLLDLKDSVRYLESTLSYEEDLKKQFYL
ncbi:CRISPR-associated endonuclease Cas2 [Candidatus Giovannonibacteria bacterium RIFCSPLOWO2_02_FULL_43_11b]|uniref:CRISPR-associated endonuclease Cas2 n=1 Tax=Candidatus Giovannonibacteria bacterium RIFCSPHIGHO2_12_FULL_43_15 TaxID=1798341 RepID=A0A1F5WR26_9BACT|nr:MAG: CRISPR-associated endonuclease Cas2 [Candidatus Giovannonibacteria bacterium RIFCSPHIGHO2_12_FULL_43_15]OGF89175.1 MAG: CRISPR-associated endonuclease Cas2 [Candidatus Giovannonibacteria bacterium RIFCSPLOWO2_02_FULL_43_11b]OGF91513.1 MAG: CRISPR-associated endonuclease Cas2 [Candidatus Giovannonibacteria bacterium RIFCSPLOWO2_12_FULL_43_11c]